MSNSILYDGTKVFYVDDGKKMKNETLFQGPLMGRKILVTTKDGTREFIIVQVEADGTWVRAKTLDGKYSSWFRPKYITLL